MALIFQGRCRKRKRRLHRFRVGLCAILVAVVLASIAGPSWSEEFQPTDVQVKAAFLYHLSKFVVWPERAFPSDSTPSRVCLLGEDPIGETLDRILEHSSAGTEGKVERFAQLVPELRGCPIVFIASDRNENLEHILEVLKHAPVATVSDIPGFADKGGMFELYTEHRRIRFAVNVLAAAEAGLRINANLLALSRIVPPDAFSYADLLRRKD